MLETNIQGTDGDATSLGVSVGAGLVPSAAVADPVGGGGHGLATAYYLARDHGAQSVAVLERGWLAGGNTARNTAIVRSNYLTPEGVRFYTRLKTITSRWPVRPAAPC